MASDRTGVTDSCQSIDQKQTKNELSQKLRQHLHDNSRAMNGKYVHQVTMSSQLKIIQPYKLDDTLIAV